MRKLIGIDDYDSDDIENGEKSNVVHLPSIPSSIQMGGLKYGDEKPSTI
jgi:hypothetical protein